MSPVYRRPGWGSSQLDASGRGKLTRSRLPTPRDCREWLAEILGNVGVLLFRSAKPVLTRLRVAPKSWIALTVGHADPRLGLIQLRIDPACFPHRPVHDRGGADHTQCQFDQR